MSTPTAEVVRRLQEGGGRVETVNGGLMARCPAHDDRNPSLSVATGDDGRVLLHCHAGCTADAIVKALGMTMADLFPDGGSGGGVAVRRVTKRAATWPTLHAAIAEAAGRIGGIEAGRWTYQDADGRDVLTVVRFDRADGKQYRPFHATADGWRTGDPAGPLPLYRLPDLGGTGRVYVVEGEKCAEAMRTIGLTATTSAHGSQSAHKSDWEPLAGRDVVIIPDNDAPGRKYAEAVAAILGELDPAAAVRTLQLPGLGEGGDIADWIDSHDAAEPDVLRAEVESMADAIAPTANPATEQTREFQPFPMETLPSGIRGFVQAAAEAIGCDPSAVVAPLLCGAASLIGNSRRIRLKPDWCEPAILWTALVAESGSRKSPTLELALKALHRMQSKRFEEHNAAVREYEAQMLVYERELAAWKSQKREGEPPVKPSQPYPTRLYCSDTTVEALATLLQQNARGLLLMRDELSGWFGSFDRYSQGGGDTAQWLEMYGGRALMVDRKTGTNRTTYVPRASVSITGGIQPETLRRMLGREHFDNGLAARFLLTMPPRRMRQWTEAEVPETLHALMDRVCERLYSLTPTLADGSPVDLPLTDEAKSVFRTFYDENAAEEYALSGDMAAAWAKLEGYAARLALVIHLLRWASDDPTLQSVDAIDHNSIAAGAKLSRWFGAEIRRIYAAIGNAAADDEATDLMDLIGQRGGRITPRELMHARRQYRGRATAAEAALQRLVDANLGRWLYEKSGAKGGRPVKVFEAVTVTKPLTTSPATG